MFASLVAIAVMAIPTPDDRVWELQGVSSTGLSGFDNLGVNTFPPGFKMSDSGVTFTDPEGKQNGELKWSGIPKQIADSEIIKITLEAQFMRGYLDSAGTSSQETNAHGYVFHPDNSVKPKETFQFALDPKEDATTFKIIVTARGMPGITPGYHGIVTTWTYGLGTGRPKPNADAILTAHDYRSFTSRARDGAPNYPAFMADVPKLNGVAADGVSLCVIRSVTTEKSKAIFRINSGSGHLYPLAAEDMFKVAGLETISIDTQEINGKHVAFALYRPPVNFGPGTGKRTVDVTVLHQLSNPSERGAEAEFEMELVRPPVVLVHGTYDNPKYCWQDHDPLDESPMNLEPRLRAAGFPYVYCVDWEETNGSKDPSSFLTNSTTVYDNKNGIKHALADMRQKNIAVTQADLVCHSQGGVISRVYMRGFPLHQDMSAGHPHYTDPWACGGRGCWYHRSENYSMGDVHRIITISSTHRGSDVCRLFEAFKKFNGGSIWDEVRSLLLDLFLVYVDKQVSGITTQGFLNQTPGSEELARIGPTPVASHAIACVATDEDMLTVRPDGLGLTNGMGNYYGKLYKIWFATPNDCKRFAFDYLAKEALAKDPTDTGPSVNAAEFNRQLDVIESPTHTRDTDRRSKEARITAIINHMRKTVFLDDENDCTVSKTSSFGGLTSQFTTRIPNVLHGWAPRYRKVQDRVIELLRNDGSLFDPNGFPNSYNGDRTRAATFLVADSGKVGSPPPTNSSPVTNNNTKQETAGIESIKGDWVVDDQVWTFRVENGVVSGSAWEDAFKVSGKFDGLVLKLTLTWRDNTTSIAELTFSADYKSFDGWYTHPDFEGKFEAKSSRGGSFFSPTLANHRRWVGIVGLKCVTAPPRGHPSGLRLGAGDFGTARAFRTR